MQRKFPNAYFQINMKNDFRKKALEIRRGLEKIDLTEKIKELSEYKRAKTIFIYISFGSEIETTKLLEDALKEKIVLVPYCVDTNGNMIACRINSLQELKPGKFGILEPENPVEYKGVIDFSVIPGVAFSKEGYRIGYGKGYYDRFLSKTETFSLGICHHELLFDEIPFDKTDVKLDMIITDKEEISL